MKALSLWQPWATLIAVGAKRVETRSWPTSYRGPLAIHAAKTFPQAAWTICWQGPFSRPILATGYAHPLALPFGALVAVVKLVDCVRVDRWMAPIEESERPLGDYSTGRFAWFLQDVRKLEKPVPYRGGQRLFDVPTSVLGGY